MSLIRGLRVDNYLLIKNLVNDFKIKNPLEYQKILTENPSLTIEFFDTPRCLNISMYNKTISFSIGLVTSMNELYLHPFKYRLVQDSLYEERLRYEAKSEYSMARPKIEFIDDVLVPLLSMEHTVDYMKISFINPKYVKVQEIKFQWFKT